MIATLAAKGLYLATLYAPGETYHAATVAVAGPEDVETRIERWREAERVSVTEELEA